MLSRELEAGFKSYSVYSVFVIFHGLKCALNARISLARALVINVIRTEPTSEHQLKVETLSMWHSLWPDTVRLEKGILSSWGDKIRQVEIEVSDEESIRWARCKVKPMESAQGGVIQMPIKLQLALQIGEGGQVTVKPVIESAR